MESDGGGVVTAAITPRRLTSQHSTLRESFLASDLADSHNNSGNLQQISGDLQQISGNLQQISGDLQQISGLTLGAVLFGDNKSPPPNDVVRTLLDIIRNDESLNGRPNPNGKKSWKSFKERLKLKRSSLSQNQNSGNSLRSSSTIAAVAMMSNRNSLRNTPRNNSIRRVDTVPADDLSMREVDSGGSPRSGSSFRLSAALAAEREETRRRLSRELSQGDGNEDEEETGGAQGNDDEDDDEDDDEAHVEAPANQPVRMSLMDLLEETDRQAGIRGPTYRLDDVEDEEEEEEVVAAAVVEEEVEEGGGDGKGEYSCCVCMVRHKGAAFIPCGHTFCRMCSRELWVQRGHCPLCNNFILEILDIF